MAAPDLVVLDASAVVAVVASGGAVGERVAARVAEAALHAPMHLPVEVDSALRGLVLAGRLTESQGASAFDAARELPIELWPWELLGERAWELRADLSTYDAGYVALAERLGAVLVTGDARIARAPGVRCIVEVVS